MEKTAPIPATRPVTDVFETKENLLLFLDMPGATAESIHLDFQGETLTITAETTETEIQDAVLKHREFGARTYRRAFEIYQPIQADSIQASLKQGLLTVTLPKATAISRKIQVQSQD